MSQNPSAKEQLTTHFESSVSAVRVYADQFEASYARPALKTTTAFFQEYPVSSTFIAIFSLLAFFPIVTFLGLSVLTIVSLTFLALCCAFVVSSAVVLLFLSILVLSLATIFFASAFLTVTTIATYLAYRFTVLVRSHGREGVSDWAIETKDRFTPSKSRNASEGSGVVVEKEPGTEWIKSDDTDTKTEGF